MKSQIGEHTRPLLSRLFKHNTMNQSLLSKEEEEFLETYEQKVKKRKKYRKVVVGNQTGFDISQFFKFKKKQFYSATSLIDQLAGGHWAWLILVYCMFNNSLVLPWMMSIDADKFLRLAWRHMFLNIILIPFMFYEKRTANEETKEKYKFQNIIQVEKLKNAFYFSLAKAFWFVIITSTFQYVTVAHTQILGNLMNFFLSINRFMDSSYHFLEPGGQIFVIFGIFLILKDQVLMDTENIDKSYHMIGFANYSWEFRLGMDFLALFVSFVMAMTYKYTTTLSKDYPSYLGMFVVNFMISILLFVASFFMHGVSFDNDEGYGIFGVFTGEHFSTFFQMSVFIGFGMLWSYAMISKLFSQPLIPSLATNFQPILSFMIMDFFGLQQVPSGFTMIGYIFIIPGIFLILIGQNIYQKTKKAEQKQMEEKIKTIFQMSQLKKKQSQFSDFCSPNLFTTIKRIQSNENQDDEDFCSINLEDKKRQQIKSISLKQIPHK